MSSETSTIRPQPGPQTQFLMSSADIAVYGGAAGGGKTWALLLEAIRHTATEGFRFVIFRRSYPEVTNPGGIWDEAGCLFRQVGGKPRVADLAWEFPSGARGRFAHLQFEDTVLDHQGGQYAYIGFDELTHFTRRQFFYLLSRNRSICGIKPYVRATTNPDATSWVKEFLGPWLTPSHYAHAQSGELRWMVPVSEEDVRWFRSPVEAKKFAAERLVPETLSTHTNFMLPEPKSVTFIRSSVFDNKVLMMKNPEYVTSLMALNPVDRARLLYGDWSAVEASFFDMWQPYRIVDIPGYGPTKVPWHVIENGEVPQTQVSLGVGIDYGFAAPFAAYLCGCDENGLITVYREIYRTRMRASEQARAVNAMLEEAGCDLRVMKWAGHDAFAAQRGAEKSGEPIVSIWNGNAQDPPERRMVNVVKAGRDPLARAAKLREYLAFEDLSDPTNPVPGIRIMECCYNLIRTIPLLSNDPNRPELVNTDQEDHAFDALTHYLVSRPSRPRPEAKARPKLEDFEGTRVIPPADLLESREEKRESEVYEW